MRRKKKDSVLEKPLDIYHKAFLSKGFVPKYKEINVSEQQGKVIREHIGEVALIKDYHHGENCYEGVINFDKKYSYFYFLVNGKRMMRFEVSDLEKLFVQNPFFNSQT